MSIECAGGGCWFGPDTLFGVIVEEPMNLSSARNAAEFVRLCSSDKLNRVTHAIVPGHEAKLYGVKFDRKDDKILVMSCRQWDEKGEACMGNQRGICYHAIAALLHAAANTEHTLSFCDKEEDALMLSRMKGKCVPVQSVRSGKMGWVVYQKSLTEQGDEHNKGNSQRETAPTTQLAEGLLP